jgi:hypothetical protein
MAADGLPPDFDDEHDDGDDLGGVLDFLTAGDAAGEDDLGGLGEHPESVVAAESPGAMTVDDAFIGAIGPTGPDAAEDPDGAQFTVANPSGAVTVATLMDGRVERIELGPEVTAMTERELAEEVVVIARLATLEARSAQYSYMLDGMTGQGHDVVATRDFLSRDLDLPSPQDAEAERARVFSSRYADDHE